MTNVFSRAPVGLLTEATKWPNRYVDRRGFAGPWCLVNGGWERLCAGRAAEHLAKDGYDFGTLSDGEGRVVASVIIGPRPARDARQGDQ